MLKIEKKGILNFILLVYLISISAFQLGSGFDAIIVRFSFVFLIITMIISYKKIVITKQTIWYFVFWIFYYISFIWSKSIEDSFYYFNNFVQIIGISLCIPLIIQEEKDMYTFFKMIVFSLLFTSALIIIRTPLSMWGTSRIGEIVGLYSNELGSRLVIGVVLLLFMMENDKKNKIFYFVSCAIFVVLSLFTGSKRAIFELLLVFILFGFKKISKTSLLKKIGIMISIILVISGIIFLTFHNEKLYNILGYRIEKTFLTLSGNNSKMMTDTSLIERNYYKKEAVDLFKQNPVFGVGANGFVTHMRIVGYKHIAYSHNNYLEILSTLGIIGFLIYYSFIFYLITVSIKLYKTDKNIKYYLNIILLAILLVTDYSGVNYIREFTAICYGIIYMNIIIKGDMSNDKDKYNNSL